MTVAERPLTGQVAWVTGSSRGLGRVIVEHLASLGAAVVVHGTTPTSSRAFNEADSLESVARAVAGETGAEILPVFGDLTDDQAVRRAVAEIHERFGRIDVLVNCAGGDIGAAGTGGVQGGKPQPNDCVEIPLADVRAVLDRNLLSCILVCRAVAPEMMQRRAGRIVNIGSGAAFHGRSEGAIYAVAKAAVTHYTRCLAAQLRPYNVPVNCVSPGGTITPRFLATNPVRQELLEAPPDTLERYGQPIEVARAVAFFATEQGGFVSGQVLRVDGGSQTWPA